MQALCDPMVFVRYKVMETCGPWYPCVHVCFSNFAHCSDCSHKPGMENKNALGFAVCIFLTRKLKTIIYTHTSYFRTARRSYCAYYDGYLQP